MHRHGSYAMETRGTSRDPKKKMELGEKQPMTCHCWNLPGWINTELRLPSQRHQWYTHLGEQGSWPLCPVQQARTAREGGHVIRLKLQKQAKCNYNHPSWSSARTSGLMVLLLQKCHGIFQMITSGQDLGFTSHLEDNEEVSHLFFGPKGGKDKLTMSKGVRI